MDLYEESTNKERTTTKFWLGNTIKWVSVAQINEKYEKNTVRNIVTHTHTYSEGE